MEEFWRRNAIIRKAVEKRMDCYRYGLPLCWVEDLGEFYSGFNLSVHPVELLIIWGFRKQL